MYKNEKNYWVAMFGLNGDADNDSTVYKSTIDVNYVLFQQLYNRQDISLKRIICIQGYHCMFSDVDRPD